MVFDSRRVDAYDALFPRLLEKIAGDVNGKWRRLDIKETKCTADISLV